MKRGGPKALAHSFSFLSLPSLQRALCCTAPVWTELQLCSGLGNQRWKVLWGQFVHNPDSVGLIVQCFWSWAVPYCQSHGRRLEFLSSSSISWQQSKGLSSRLCLLWWQLGSVTRWCLCVHWYHKRCRIPPLIFITQVAHSCFFSSLFYSELC